MIVFTCITVSAILILVVLMFLTHVVTDRDIAGMWSSAKAEKILKTIRYIELIAYLVLFVGIGGTLFTGIFWLL